MRILIDTYAFMLQAVILVQDSKKHFYKKFLYEPFPVESKLPAVLHDHINAGVIRRWCFFFVFVFILIRTYCASS